ncbi:MAG TPA: DUF4129 domain-containing protein, partial [Candidatus Thermoplasmatota archaeon]|nr:DUF4129 domain-containing protein [Candidatus Thermoplasmatota archaeon]
APLTVTLSADSVLTFEDLPDEARAGGDLEVHVHLADSGGTPLTDLVEVHFAGRSGTVRPDPASGKGSVVLANLPSAAGLGDLSASSHPASPLIRPGFAVAQIPLRIPAMATLDPLPETVDAGGILRATGRLLANGARVADAPLTVLLRGPDGTVASIPSTSGDGAFAVAVPVNASLPRGEYVLAVEASPTPATTAAVATGEVRVRSLPQFLLASSDPLDLGRTAQVAAVLVEPDGLTPLPNATVLVRLGHGEAPTTTDAKGRLNASFPSGMLAAGPVLQSLRFDGDAEHAPAEAHGERFARSATRLSVTAGEVARGASATVPLRLADASGRPLANRTLTARWGSDAEVALMTGGEGVAHLVRAGTPSDPLGAFTVWARYDGSANGTFGPSTAEATWTVRSLAALQIPNGSFEAGTSIPFGQLRDAGTGAPLPHHPITLRIGGANATTVVTDSQGRFAVLAPVPRSADPAFIEVHADYPGGPVYPATRATAQVFIRSPVELHPLPLPTLVAGRPTLAVVDVRDARGLDVPNGVLNATLGSVPAGSAQVSGGVARIELLVPADHPAGASELRFAFLGTRAHGPAQASMPVQVVAPASLSIAIHPADPGSFATVHVTATSNGKPLAGSPVFLQVEGLSGGLEGTTDKEGVARFLVLQGNRTLALSARYGGSAATSPAAASASLAPLPPFTLQEGLRLGVWIAGAAALALAAAAYLSHRLRVHPLAPAVRRARRAVRARGTHEQQILLAYQVLEDAAIAHELLDAEAHTPRLLQEAIGPTLPPAVRPSLERLISLFEVARYGTQPMGPGHRDAALTALADLRRALARASLFDARPNPAGRAA